MRIREELKFFSNEFQAVGIRTVDTKQRIGLGKKVLKSFSTLPEAYKVFIDKEGDILLQPVVTIPTDEAWIYQNPKVIGQIRKGLAEVKQGKIEKVKNIDVFLKKL